MDIRIKGTICLVSRLIGGKRMFFSSVGVQTDAIKLAMAGTQDWWR